MMSTGSTTPFVPLKFIAEIVSGGTPKADSDNWNGDIPFITPPDLNGLDGDVVSRWERTLTKDGTSGSSITNDAVLLSCRAPIGHVGVVTSEVAFNQGCKSIVPQDADDLAYVAYCLVASRRALQALGRGTTFTELSTTELSNLSIPWPVCMDRRAITRYLDRETGEIDAMLAKLDELREQLIQRRLAAVDNEFSCVGTSSKARLPFVADVIPGLTYSPSDIVDSGGVVVHRAGSVQNSRIDRSDLVRVSTSIPAKLFIQPGDILVCTRNGSAHLVGKCAIVGISEIGETWGAFMTVLRSQHYRYIYWYMQSSLFAQERKQYFTSTINQLTVGMFSRMMIPFPESHVQERIADHLDEVTGRIDAMLANIDELRALLVERRAALITDVVTGRKKVPA
jgi:hypothetical protein